MMVVFIYVQEFTLMYGTLIERQPGNSLNSNSDTTVRLVVTYLLLATYFFYLNKGA